MMIKVYYSDCRVLNDEILFAEYFNKMPSFRQESAARYMQKNDRLLCVGAWALLSRVLSLTGKEKILFTENGKPYFESGVYFNLSHSGNIAALAVGDRDIGCDVERIKELKTNIADRFFYNEEARLLKSIKNDEERTTTFFRLWTLKESFMKVTGLGFRLALSDFCVYFENGVPKVRQSVDEREYFFKEYGTLDGYALSVCAAGEGEFAREPERIELDRPD